MTYTASARERIQHCPASCCLPPQLKKAAPEDVDELRAAWREAQNRLAGVKTNGGAA